MLPGFPGAILFDRDGEPGVRQASNPGSNTAGGNGNVGQLTHRGGLRHCASIRNRMRYLVKARVKPGKSPALQKAIQEVSLGAGSIAGDEYLRNMEEARALEDGRVCWIEVCFCPTPLQEERPYWEEYFDLLQVKDAHARSRCRDENGTEPWACCDCDCTDRLEAQLKTWGCSFLSTFSE